MVKKTDTDKTEETPEKPKTPVKDQSEPKKPVSDTKKPKADTKKTKKGAKKTKTKTAAKKTTKKGAKKPAKKETKAKKAQAKKKAEPKKQDDPRLLIQAPVKFGRPEFKITKAIEKKAYDLASKGLHDYQIAAGLGIHRDTLLEKKKEFSDFSGAIEQGRGVAILNMENAVYQMGLSGNIHAAKYWLNNKASQDWKDKREVALTVPRTVTDEQMAKMDEAELEAIANSENVELIRVN